MRRVDHEEILIDSLRQQYGSRFFVRCPSSRIFTQAFGVDAHSSTSFISQFAVFEHALVVLGTPRDHATHPGPHGAGLSNFVATRGNATLVEFAVEPYNNPAYGHLAAALGRHYVLMTEVGLGIFVRASFIVCVAMPLSQALMAGLCALLWCFHHDSSPSSRRLRDRRNTAERETGSARPPGRALASH
jgi:hypothetical protein